VIDAPLYAPTTRMHLAQYDSAGSNGITAPSHPAETVQATNFVIEKKEKNHAASFPDYLFRSFYSACVMHYSRPWRYVVCVEIIFYSTYFI
jgi:hypothetical protein